MRRCLVPGPSHKRFLSILYVRCPLDDDEERRTGLLRRLLRPCRRCAHLSEALGHITAVKLAQMLPPLRLHPIDAHVPQRNWSTSQQQPRLRPPSPGLPAPPLHQLAVINIITIASLAALRIRSAALDYRHWTTAPLSELALTVVGRLAAG